MTRRDYITIADALRGRAVKRFTHLTDAEHAKAIVEEMAGVLGDVFYRDNPRFDLDHFLAVVRGEKDLNSRPARKLRHYEHVMSTGPVPRCTRCGAFEEDIYVGNEPCNVIVG